MPSLPACLQCNSNYTYQDRHLFVCPVCGYEWQQGDSEDKLVVLKDAVGNTLIEGDRVTVIKDLKVKGSSAVIKIGSKAKIIHIVDGDHDIDCKVDGAGAMMLKSKFVKKA
jgi:protein PhnA